MKADSNCPYNCIEGKVFDHLQKMLVPCPHCSSKMNKVIIGVELTEDGKSANELLHIPVRYKTKEFTKDNVIPDNVLMSNESVKTVMSELDNLMAKARVGEILDYSVMFNLGKEADILNFIFNYLKICLVSGLSVCPLVSTTDLYALRSLADGSDFSEYRKVSENLGVSYYDLENREVCIVTADAGAKDSAWYYIKGLMEGRERNGLPTIIFTNSVKLLDNASFEKSLHTAILIGIEYELDTFNNKATGIVSIIEKCIESGTSYASSYMSEADSKRVLAEFNTTRSYLDSIKSSNLGSSTPSTYLRELRGISNSFAIFSKLSVDRASTLNISSMVSYIKNLNKKLDICSSKFSTESCSDESKIKDVTEIGNKTITMSDLSSLSTNNSIKEAYSLGQRDTL